MARTDGKEMDLEGDRPAKPVDVDGVHARRLAIFEDRYGVGSYERLLLWFRQPCVTFAEIAERLHVTRERVRQWHVLLMPGAPTGRARRRQCGLDRQRRRLLEDPVFGIFYRHVRRHFERSLITLIRSRSGYRSGIARIEGRLVAIREGSLQGDERGHAPSRTGPLVYRLRRYRGRAEFVYFQLSSEDFLVIPAALLPVQGTTFSDDPAERYWQFKNTFSALRAQTAGRESDH